MTRSRSGPKKASRRTWATTTITSKLKTQLIADGDVKSINYTVTTVKGVVYIIGSARSQAELDRVIDHARNIGNVRRVVSYVRIRAGEPPEAPRPKAPPGRARRRRRAAAAGTAVLARATRCRCRRRAQEIQVHAAAIGAPAPRRNLAGCCRGPRYSRSLAGEVGHGARRRHPDGPDGVHQHRCGFDLRAGARGAGARPRALSLPAAPSDARRRAALCQGAAARGAARARAASHARPGRDARARRAWT